MNRAIFMACVLALAACGGGHDDSDDSPAPPPAPPRIEATFETRPRQIGTDNDWASAAPGHDSLCALKRAGSRWCAGNNDRYQFGAAEPALTRAFVRADDDYWVAGAAGRATAAPYGCGVTKGGALRCWGTPLGTEDAPSPELFSRPGWAKVSVGVAHACAIARSGALACWGTNEFGRLGVDRSAAAAPVIVDDAHDWRDVAAGERHTCAVRGDGTLWCWGAADQAGANGMEPREPMQISGGADWTAVTAGSRHTCALRGNGVIWCWGAAESGQLGIGVSNNPWLIPVSLGSTGWKSVAAGGHHTCAINEDYRLYCWGANDQGQLGVGSRTLRDVPTGVSGSTAWSHVAANGPQTCGVRATGELYCWGRILEGVGVEEAE